MFHLELLLLLLLLLLLFLLMLLLLLRPQHGQAAAVAPLFAFQACDGGLVPGAVEDARDGTGPSSSARRRR